MPGAIFKRGQRITLRTVEREEIGLLQRARNEPEFRSGFLLDQPENRTEVEEYFEENIEGDESSIYLLIYIDQDAIGGISLRDIRQSHGMLTYWLLPDKRGHGYMTEAAALMLDHAFDALGLHRVYAWTIGDNEPSKGVLHRLGFTQEGTLREHVFARGDYWDADYFGLLASEWDGAEPVLEQYQ